MTKLDYEKANIAKKIARNRSSPCEEPVKKKRSEPKKHKKQPVAKDSPRHPARKKRKPKLLKRIRAIERKLAKSQPARKRVPKVSKVQSIPRKPFTVEHRHRRSVEP
jgi:hypothetical protein